VHIGSELHLEAGRRVATNIFHDLDVLTEELVYRSVLLHNFQNPIDETHLLSRAFQMPHQLMKKPGWLLSPPCSARACF